MLEVTHKKDNGETWLFRYDESSSADLLRLLGRYASQKYLGFNWYDAAVLSREVRRAAEGVFLRAQQAAGRFPRA